MSAPMGMGYEYMDGLESEKLEGPGGLRLYRNSYDMVEDDFNLVCYDMVSNPSTSGAYMNLQESVEYRTLVSQNRIVLLDEILNDILEL